MRSNNYDGYFVPQLKKMITKRKLGPYNARTKKAQLITLLENSDKLQSSSNTKSSSGSNNNTTVVNIYCHSVDVQSSGEVSTRQKAGGALVPVSHSLNHDNNHGQPPAAVHNTLVRKHPPVKAHVPLQKIPARSISSKERELTKTVKEELDSMKKTKAAGLGDAFKNKLANALGGGPRY
jgi:hypothetical protein